MAFISKTNQVREAIAKGDKKAALRMASDFRIGVTPAQHKALKLAYECMHYADTYRQMKVDVDEAVRYGWTLLVTLPVITGSAS